MLNRCYHIHVASTPDIAPELLDSLALFFEQKAFLTYDLMTNQPQTAGYSHRCIERCDFVMLLIVGSYGVRSNTGVSQLHLSYAYAKTKNKPILVLVKSQQEVTSPHQLLNFINMVKDYVGQVYYFKTRDELEAKLTEGYEALVLQYSDRDWAQSHLAVNDSALASQLKAVKTSASEVGRVDQKQSGVIKASQGMFTKPTTLAAGSRSPLLRPALSDIDRVLIDDEVILHYSAHAYEDGNLTEVSMSVAVRWRSIVTPLLTLPMPFSSHALQRSLNNLVASFAEQDIPSQMPRVHAVSRCQVTRADRNKVLKTLRKMGWISLQSNQSRQLWQITDQVRRLLA